MIDLTKLRYFYIVAKHQHVTRAAEEIHIAQPALTKTVKQLEQELDVPLFYKHGRNIRLTEFGQYLYRKLESVFTQIDSIPEELELLQEEARHTVKINVLAASTAVTDAVVAYKKKHPNVVFQLIQNETETDCHVSVTTNTANLSALPPFIKRTIMEENIYLAVPKNSRYANRLQVDLKEVKDEEFIHLAGSRLFRSVCDGFCAAAGFKPRTAFESDSPVAVRNIIAANAGVGFWPEYSWGKVSSDVALLSISSPVCQREIVLGLHEHPVQSYTAEDFYAYLIRFLQNRRNRNKNVK